MSLYYPLTPVHRYCPDCHAFGRLSPDWVICGRCGGIGRIFVDGGPAFGCRETLGAQQPGAVLTLGNGDRGRVIQHIRRGEHDTPTTNIALIDDFLETEDVHTTSYPSSTGVRSVSPSSWLRKPEGARGRADHVDPLQRMTRAL